MHSCKFYLSKTIDDLRHELASRDLPTEGLKKDLAWRLASLDDAHEYLPTRTSSSATRNEEFMIAKIQDCSVPSAEVRGRRKKSSSSSIGSSLVSVHGYRDNDNDRHISNIARSSVTFPKGMISILLMVLLSCLLWYNTSTADKECFNRCIEKYYDFLSSSINKWLKFAQLPHGCQLI